MGQYLPFVMQKLLNTPLLLAPARADMIVAALSGRLDIRSLEDDSVRLDARGLRDLAEMGRVDTDARAAAKSTPGPEAQIIETEYRPYRMTDSGIAIISIHGTLVRSWGIGPYSGSTGYDGIWTQLLHAQDNDKVEAIWLDINSGGGEVDGCFDLVDGIYRMSARFGGKPIYAMHADSALSAAYALASAADRLFMPKLGQTGSIGCLVMHAEISAALEEEGVKVTIIRDPDGKARGNPVEPLDEETFKRIYAMVREVNLHFVDVVARNRAITKKAVSETNGFVYTGQQALATGLVNEVLSEPDAWMKLERKIARK
jgi:signal peptide peptidase SppA